MEFIKSRIIAVGLWPRVALAISVGFLLLFLSFALLGERELQESMERQRGERLVIAQFAASQIDGVLKQAVFTLEQASEHFDPNSGQSILAAMTNALEAEAVLAHFSSGLILLDVDGYSVSSLPTGLYPAGSNLSGLPHIAKAIELEQITISDPFQDPVDGQPVVAITVPLFEGGRLQGFLSGFLNLMGEDVMAPLRHAAVLHESEHAVLVDSQGRVVISTFALPFLSPGEHHAFYREAMDGGKPVVETVPFELDLPGEPAGHLHLMAFVPLQNVPWGLSIGGDEADIFSGIQNLRQGLIVIGIVALIGVWSFTLIGTRRLVRPIRQLTDAADQIAAGNLEAPLKDHAGGEIGIMTVALERMRNQLLSDIQELAHWNETLEERVSEQTRDLRKQQRLTRELLREVVNAQENERSRLARELHDEIGQTLTAVELSLGYLANALPPEGMESRRRLAQSRALIEQTTVDLRAIIAALRPGVLDQLGLVPALEWISDHTLRPGGISVSFDSQDLDRRLPKEIETTLFRIAQEAMSNVGRHSQASALDVHLRSTPREVTMTLRDNGKGLGNNEDRASSMGLVGMKERATLSGGELTIESLPDQGTMIQVTIPITGKDEEGDTMSSQPIRLIAVDDHAIMREGLVNLLEQEPDLEIVGTASTGGEAIELVREEAADIVLLDIVLDDMSGLEAARQIIADSPSVKVIMLTMYEEEAFIQEAFEAGASGYFLKGSNSDELIRTIRKVQKGEAYLPSNMSHRQA